MREFAYKSQNGNGNRNDTKVWKPQNDLEEEMIWKKEIDGYTQSSKLITISKY